MRTVTTPDVVRDRFAAASRNCPPGSTLTMATTPGYEICACDQGHPDVVDCDRRMVLLRVSRDHICLFRLLPFISQIQLCFANEMLTQNVRPASSMCQVV